MLENNTINGELEQNKKKASEIIERLKGLTIQEALFVLDLCKSKLMNEQIVI